jgi:integrase
MLPQAHYKPTALHYDSPTYGYRKDLLLDVNENKDKKYTTASSYINYLRSFYEFLIRNKVVSETGFFVYETASTGQGHIQSTDLRIKKVRKHGESLNPLNQKQAKRALLVINSMSERDRLFLNLMIGSGLRSQECNTMNAELFTIENLHKDDSFLIKEIEISPQVGVMTKFDTPRDLFITRPFFESIMDYIESEEYEALLSLFKKNNKSKKGYTPLFITTTGTAFDEYNKRNVWLKFKYLYEVRFGEKLNQKPHDLRATFGTNLLKLLTNAKSDVIDALGFVKDTMGHQNEATTLRYVRYLKHSKMLNKAADILDVFAAEILIAAA